MYDVVSIGILVADVIAKTVDKLPDKGKLDLVDQVELYTGGCAMSSAIDMARIGLDVAIIGKIGADGFGSYLKNSLIDEGINIEGLVIDKETSTSASVVTSDSDGERSFLHCVGANGVFEFEDVNFNVIENAKIVFIAGTMLMPAFDGIPCAKVLKKAKEMGKYTVLDTAWDSKGRWMEVLRPCMEYIDLFIPSYEEAVELSGEKEPEKIADIFIEMGIETVVIKLGKDGCYIKDKKGVNLTIPTYSDIKPVDTTGAGDSFCAGFLTGLSKSWSLIECGKFANAVGTHCIMALGASTGIKSLEEIKKFMRKYEK